MKKFFILSVILLAGNLWAESPSLTDFYFLFEGDWYLRGGEKTGVHKNMGTDMYAVYDADNGNKINNMSLFVDENGYVSLLYGETFYTVLGKNIGSLNEKVNSTDYILPDYIKSIKSENFLTEKVSGKTINYKAENLLKSGIWGSRETPYIYNNLNTPFVPEDNGKKGVGTKLTVSLQKAQQKIMILGGYVDAVRHPDYYYKNCRPKTIKIKDLDSDYSVTCELKDLPVYQSFDFEKPLTNIELEVLEVYPGSKYTDLCISGILF